MPLNMLALPFFYAFSSIAANKLLIAVRCVYYHNPTSSSDTELGYSTTIRFESNIVAPSNSTDDHSQLSESESFDNGSRS